MKLKSLIPFAAILLAALPAAAATAPNSATPNSSPKTTTAKADATHIVGQYIESRTADVYTGPCFANSEVNLAGKQAVMAWHVDRGVWNGVTLDGLNVVAVVRANATLGDPFSNPYPAKTLFIVDETAAQSQRDALVQFAQSQANGLLNDVVAVQTAPISFATMVNGERGSATLKAGNLVAVTSRAADDRDLLCHNEEVYYPPLAANLTHSMPAVATESAYTGKLLGVTWSESYRRGVFVGAFSE
jgi:hypothetical protein